MHHINYRPELKTTKSKFFPHQKKKLFFFLLELKHLGHLFIQIGIGATDGGGGNCIFREDFSGGICHRRPYPGHPGPPGVYKGHLV